MAPMTRPDDESITADHAMVQQVLTQVARRVVGQQAMVERLIISLLTGGHVLLEGAPGLGKTLLVKTLARCLELDFSRIQFTPDLMPSDVTGTNVLVGDDSGRRSFSLHQIGRAHV